MHPLAACFPSVVDAYESGRPEYAPAVVGALSAELGLSPGSRVLDLGAGTGKLTRSLLAAELDVVAVEPQAELRGRLAMIADLERVLEGAAEAIPLDEGSVDAVTVADAFHWFDGPAALLEIRRVLGPGGGLAVISAVPDWEAAPWAHELGALLAELRPPHPFFDGPTWRDAVRDAEGWAPPRTVEVTAPQPTDAKRLLDYVASMSFVAVLEEEKRSRALKRTAELLDDLATPTELPIRFTIGLSGVRNGGPGGR